MKTFKFLFTLSGTIALEGKDQAEATVRFAGTAPETLAKHVSQAVIDSVFEVLVPKSEPKKE